MNLTVHAGEWAVCRLSPDARLPEWATRRAFWSVTRTPDELSIVTPAENVPEGVTAEAGWALLKVEGPLDFSLTGILASLTVPLGEAGISVFAVATYDTDYLLVPTNRLEDAVSALTGEGYFISR